MFKLKTIFIALGLMANFNFLMPAAASAQLHELRCGANSAATGTDTNKNGCAEAPKNQPSLNDTVAKIINILSSLVAAVAVIMIIVGGFRYVTSGGDSARVTSAKSTIFNAIIGLVIAIFAQVIVRFVIYEAKK
jgi:magnesium-transporting ATPase (P-type)